MEKLVQRIFKEVSPLTACAHACMAGIKLTARSVSVQALSASKVTLSIRALLRCNKAMVQ